MEQFFVRLSFPTPPSATVGMYNTGSIESSAQLFVKGYLYLCYGLGGLSTIGDRVEYMRLLVEPLIMRIDNEKVIGVQELASGFIRRGFSFIFPYDLFVEPNFRVSYQLTPTKRS